MRKICSIVLLLSTVSPIAFVAHAETPAATAAKAIPVTADNFPRTESDLYFSHLAKAGGFGELRHVRQPVRVTHQSVVRLNRDTLYSSGVFDLDVGPVTVTMPNPGKRYLSVQIEDEDHYSHEKQNWCGKVFPGLLREADGKIHYRPGDPRKLVRHGDDDHSWRASRQQAQVAASGLFRA